MEQEKLSTVENRIAKDKEILLKELSENPIVEVACQRAEISRSTYYRYRQDPEFAKKADEALQDGTLLMNDMAESYLLSAIRTKNMSAITLWLRVHHPAYANKLQINGTLQQARENLTPEQQAVVEEALRLSAIVTKENIEKLKH
jgi:ACT domain-containing protein